MRSLAGLRVWITRPQPEADLSARRWSSRGADPIVLPLLEVRGREITPSQRQEVRDFEADVVVLSSANVAEFFVEAFGGSDAAQRPWTAACVGAKTARRARDLGLKVEIVADRATGEDLARTILREKIHPSCLVPGGSRQRPELLQSLREGGCEILTVSLYDTVEVGIDSRRVEQVVDRGVDLVACYSPSAVEALLRWDDTRELAIAALGSTTAAEVERRGGRLGVCPDQPGESQLLEAAVRWWGRRDAQD